MKYGLLLWPHANARYQAEETRLARAELELILGAVCPGARVDPPSEGGLNMIGFTTPDPLTAGAERALAEHSLMYVLFRTEGELLRPLGGRAPAYLGDDLPGILKYKGKTNEFFTSMLINAALYASRFRGTEGIRFADPMCSRGTALFQAVNRGWDADGTDISGADIAQLNQFFKRYLEYHRIKHNISKKSYTVKGSAPVPATEFTFAADSGDFRGGRTHTLRSAQCDCGAIAAAFGRSRYHIMACDLPYGVQHSAGAERFDRLLARALPVWREALMPGGAVALSFNRNTLKTDVVRGTLADSGFAVMDGGPWDGFAHWVEQAVERDIAVAVRPGS